MIRLDIDKTLQGANAQMQLRVNLEISRGDFVALAGQSGSGKTTLLRILAGLEDATGEIRVGTDTWLKQKWALPPQKREIGFVFQDYALFENMSVEQNLLFINNDQTLANRLLEITQLKKLKKRLPCRLSGGQKQRVALCRALMKRPKLLLLDEPLSALDPAMRTKLQNEILHLHKLFGTTTIMVSHDPSEIYKLANRVIVLQNGQIINDGAPKEVFLQTSSSQKFSFEGELLDIIEADVVNIAVVSIGQRLVEVVLSKGEAKKLQIGQVVRIGSKAFSPMIT